MFKLRPRVQAVALTPQQTCWVIDDALADPRAWVDFAQQHRARFEDSPRNAYPGPELPLQASALQALEGFFSAHLRDRLGMRRVQRTTARLSLTLRAAHELQPRQSICHVDRMALQPGQRIAACVLYLFDDPTLGGTSFYMPRRPLAEIATLLQDSASMTSQAFTARHGIAPGYMVDSNDWFQRVATVPARFNRLVAYSGTVFHSGDIRRPERLTGDPRTGRLCINGFFVGSRPLDA